MLDVDNGPSPLVNERNAWLYTDNGLRSIRNALKNGGKVAIWSANDEPRFISRMKRNGFLGENTVLRRTKERVEFVT